jgi:ubiquitin-protein ligase E3 A
VSKEFFQLLVRDIFLPDFGMFEYTEETREYWFSPAAMSMGASPLDFKMVGIVMGLGIFNAVILDVRLPLVSHFLSQAGCVPAC